MTHFQLTCILFLLSCVSLSASNGSLIGPHEPPAASCATPALLSVPAQTDSTATLTWTDVGDAYDIEVRPLGQAFTGIATHSITSDPPHTITALIPGTQYRFQVRSNCTANGMGVSPWSTPRTFATHLNNSRPCPLDFSLRDTSCTSGGQLFTLKVDNAPGNTLGTNVRVTGIRLALEHPWRSDLRAWLTAPDGTRVQVLGNLNAGDQNIGTPPTAGNPCWSFVELTDASTALLLSDAAEQDNITGLYRAIEPIATFNNGQNPNGNWLLEICDAKLVHTGRLRLAQIVFEPIGCPAITGVALSDIELNSVTISWDSNSIVGDSIQVSYGPKGFIPGSGLDLVLSNATATVTLSGLTTLTDYDIYLRQRCAPGLWSGYSALVSCFTVCPATLEEGFENYPICLTGCTDACPLPGLWQNASGDDYEWKVRTGTGGTYPNAGPKAASAGDNYLFYRNACTGSGANGKKTILRSLCIDVVAPAGPPCHFAFDVYMNTKIGTMSNLALQVSTNGGLSWATIQIWSGNRGKRWRREFVNLSAFNGQTCLFQFVVTGVLGAYGDLALDNLSFYGSLSGGSPDYTFYRDQDGDGFGALNQPLIACSPQTPVGYAALSTDCNDSNPIIFPGAPEIVCNGIDENCNGTADDHFIAIPTVRGDTICFGMPASLSALSAPQGIFYWWSAQQGGSLLGIGNTLILNNLTQSTTVWLADSIASVTGGCTSARIAVQADVNAQPDLALANALQICTGASVNLTTASVTDLNSTAGTISFHTATPTNTGNQLSNTIVNPVATTIYWVRKTTSDGCFDEIQIPVTVSPRPSVSVINGDSVSICKNKTVSLSANGIGGTAPLNYAWSNGLNFNTISVQATGGTITYTVTVTDLNGCSANDNIRVKTLSSITQTTVVAVQDATICGTPNGSIAVLPVDGQAPYTLSWSGPVSGSMTGVLNDTAVIAGLLQGGYRITVTDASGSGCSMVLPALVINSPDLMVNPPVLLQPTCPGGTGSIALLAIGTNPQFTWQHGPSTAIVSGLVSGTYTVTITDGACEKVLSDLTIQAPPPLQIIPNQIVQETCAERNDGAIDLAVFGATQPYTFIWNDAVTTEDRQHLAAGTYTATITDANGCSAVSPNFTITQPGVLQAAAVPSAVSCFGLNDGAAAVTISGGSLPYQYHWSNGFFTQNLNQVAAGNFTLTITDAKGCSVIRTTTISEPAPLNFAGFDALSPTCVGQTDGSLQAQVTGGNTPYFFNWNTGQSSDIAANLDAGTYRVTITDIKGCSTSSPDYILYAPQLLTLQLDSLKNISCFGLSDGVIGVQVHNATGTLSTTWNGATGNLIQTNIAAGTYLLEATDGRGCSIRDTFVLQQPTAPLQLSLLSANNIACWGEPTGNIEVRTSGGTLPYQYLWSNTANYEDLNGVSTGTYSLTATDAQGCTTTLAPVTLSEPSPIQADADITNIACFGPSLGNIQLEVAGGILPYSYLWSNGATTQDVYNMSAGEYTVTIFDANGCTLLYDRLSVLNAATDFALQIVQSRPVSCNSDDDGALEIAVLNGTPPYQFAWSSPIGIHPNSNSPTDLATNLSGGAYFVTVTDALGCFKTLGPIVVEESPVINITVGQVAPVICKGDSTGMIQTTISGGVPPYNLLWSNGDTTQVFNQVPAGAYQLAVTDWRGCTVQSPFITIAEPATGLLILLDQIMQDVCGDSSGVLLTQATGGYAPYTYLWNNGMTTSDLSHLSTGSFQVTSTDSKGCTAASPVFQINALSNPLSLAAFSKTNVACRGASTGAISVGVSGGALPLQFFWNNGLTGPNITNLPVGTYHLTVTDANDCTAEFILPPVTQPGQFLDVSWNIDSLSDGWQITLLPFGGVPGYYTTWDAATGNQIGLVASGLASGTYTATITDAGGCSLIAHITTGTSATNSPTTELSCTVVPNPTSGSVTISVKNIDYQAISTCLYTALGQEILRSTGPDLDLADYPSGVYLIRVQAGRQLGWTRVVKN